MQLPTKISKAKIGCNWFLRIIKVRKEEEIQSGISKGLKGHSVYNMFCITRQTTKCFNPFIIFRIFRIIKVKDTGIPIHIWGKGYMGYYFLFLRTIFTFFNVW